MEKNKVDVIFLIYTTLIATFTFLWNVRDSIIKNRRKLIIAFNINGYKQVVSKYLGILKKEIHFSSNLDKHIEILITNISNNEILIYEPPKIYNEAIKFFKGSFISLFQNNKSINFKQQYPIRLLPGERIILINTELDLNEKSNFRIKIKDSYGNTYKSGIFKNDNIC